MTTMLDYPEAEKIGQIIDGSNTVVIIQADNPDADSLASSLALEKIFGGLGKTPTLYCGVGIPSYLSHLPGSDRVVTEFPHSFDASVIVDTSSLELLEQLQKSGAKSWVASKPCIVLDHHTTEPTIDFAEVICSPKAVATGEVIYELARQLRWPLNIDIFSLIASAILGDSLGLMTADTSSRSIQIIAELVDKGVDLPDLENTRRETMRREPELVHYKGRLLQRVEFHHDNQIASLTIPWEEIEKYSPLYNPPMLVLDDMRLAKGTHLAVCFKIYNDGKVTAKIRCNHGYGIADKLAEHFGGGGHPYAAGFKIQNGRSYEEIKNLTITKAAELISKIGK